MGGGEGVQNHVMLVSCGVMGSEIAIVINGQPPAAGTRFRTLAHFAIIVRMRT